MSSTDNRITMKMNTFPTKQQRGFVLALCLILLLIMTILGVTALNTTVSEEGMARDIQESVRAFQNAESGASLAAAYIDENTKNRVETGGPATPNTTNAGNGLPDSYVFNSVIRKTDLEYGSTSYTVRKLSSIEGAPPGCMPPGKEQSGGCTQYFEYRSTGTTPQAARTTVYGGGCIFTQVEGGTFQDGDGDGGFCN